MNSDMSMRTIASSVSNRNSASAFESSVLPTPVGPRNRKEPFGRFGSDSPARERRIASDTALTASSWPTTRLPIDSSILSSFSRSPSSILDTGMPVHFETTSAISSSVTLLRTSVGALASASCAAFRRFSSSGIFPYCSSDIRARSPARRAASNSRRARSSSSLMCAVPCTAAFSDFQTSSRSEYSRSSSFNCASSVCSRFFDASSLSFLSASRSILSCTIAPVEPVELLGLGVDLHADARRRLVDQVDRLVGELPIRDVAVRERGRGHDRGIGDLDLVVDRIALLQAAQDRDRVLDRGLVDQHRLETTLERGVLLDVLAILVERGRADAVQLAARERGLQHVARVHGALGLAGADHGVQLVDEEDDAAFLLGEVVEHSLEPLLELAAELRARDQRAHVERENALVAQALGHLAVDDALCKTLDDRGLADTRLADQHRVVLGAPLQHLDRATDLVVAADDRVELALLGALGQVDGVFLERLAALLGVRVVHFLAAAHVLDRALQRPFHDAGIAQDRAQRALVVERREHEQLARDVLVTALLRELVGQVEQLRDRSFENVHFAARALDAWAAGRAPGRAASAAH